MSVNAFILWFLRTSIIGNMRFLFIIKSYLLKKNETVHKLILDIYIINKSQRNTHKVGILYISSKSEKKHSIPIP